MTYIDDNSRATSTEHVVSRDSMSGYIGAFMMKKPLNGGLSIDL